MSNAPFALTPRQREVLDLLIAAIDSTGVTPSFQEIVDAANLASKSEVSRILAALEQRGWIERQHNRARAIRILRRPEDLEAQWLIWSVAGKAWWSDDSDAFTDHLINAKRYTRDDALRICADAVDHWNGKSSPYRIPVRLEDAEAVIAKGAATTSAILAHAADQRGRA